MGSVSPLPRSLGTQQSACRRFPEGAGLPGAPFLLFSVINPQPCGIRAVIQLTRRGFPRGEAWELRLRGGWLVVLPALAPGQGSGAVLPARWLYFPAWLGFIAPDDFYFPR